MRIVSDPTPPGKGFVSGAPATSLEKSQSTRASPTPQPPFSPMQTADWRCKIVVRFETGLRTDSLAARGRAMRIKMRFLPLLILYVLVLFSNPHHYSRTDETRYMWFAENLSKGYYTTDGEVNLWTGPGYPLVLSPFVALGLPWFAARALNVVFMFGAVLYLYAALRHHVNIPAATIGACVLGIWPTVVRFVPRLMTETLAVFLVCGFIFHLARLHREERLSRGHLLAASCYLAYLALTRVLFGYVILAGLVVFLILYLLRRQRSLGKDLLAYCVALLLCVPYLLYTHSVTGKVFCWANSGGLSLYWMSSPYETDLGDWHAQTAMSRNPELKKNHMEFFGRIAMLSNIERDDALKAKALENIARHPGKFLRNWVANVGRLLFNYPYSYRTQKIETYSRMIPGMLIVVFGLLCVYPTYAGRRRIPHHVWSLLVFGVLAFGGSSLLSAYNRLFVPLVPVTVVWITVTLARLVRVEVRR